MSLDNLRLGIIFTEYAEIAHYVVLQEQRRVMLTGKRTQMPEAKMIPKVQRPITHYALQHYIALKEL